MTVTLYLSLLIICLATTAPSVWSTAAEEYPSCVNEHCNISKPYCNLYEYGYKADGNCVHSMIGPVCAKFTDLTSQGCTCNDTKCVVRVLTAWHINQAIQVSATAVAPSENKHSSPIPTTSAQSTLQPLNMAHFFNHIYTLCNRHTCGKCHLYVYHGEVNGMCTDQHRIQHCSTSEDLEHNGCVCSSEICITETIVDYATKYLTSQSKTTTTTTSLPTKTTKTATSASTSPVLTSSATSEIQAWISTVNKTTSATMFTSVYVTISTDALTTTIESPSTKATVTATTMEQYWTCLDHICHKNEVCRLKLNLNGINATCENKTQTGEVCVDHSSISKNGCLCASEVCVVKTALHCLGTNCPVEKMLCSVYKLPSGSFSGNCTDMNLAHYTQCPQKPDNFIGTCDCFTQACVNVYKTPTRKCHICGDQSNGMPCSSKEINNSPQTMCTSGEYCMTDVLQDAQGNLEVYKRCVDTITCEKEWIQETADHDYCKRYGTVINPGAFSCHFCCNADGCNTNILPNSSTWYSTQNGK